jgi:hypothetical protein
MLGRECGIGSESVGDNQAWESRETIGDHHQGGAGSNRLRRECTAIVILTGEREEHITSNDPA